MSALSAVNLIMNNDKLAGYDFAYCLVGSTKIPYTCEGRNAKPNDKNSFCNGLDLVSSRYLDKLAGVGISIQFSNVCAIDVDGCFSVPFDINSADDRAKDIIDLFKDLAYIEFSFSGKGLRIIFKNNGTPKDYEVKYYTKNSKTRCEYYYPQSSARYVTLTGRTIKNNCIELTKDEDEFNLLNTLQIFFDKYMKRETPSVKVSTGELFIHIDNRSVEELMKKVRLLYLKDVAFQNAWFMKAPGSGSNESETDCLILSKLYDNITKDKEKIRIIFESSKYFKSKDYKHIYKWNHNDHKYYDGIYNKLINGTLFRIKEE